MPNRLNTSASSKSPSARVRGGRGRYPQAGGPQATKPGPDQISMLGGWQPRRNPAAIPAAQTSASLAPGAAASSIACAMWSPAAAEYRTAACSSCDRQMVASMNRRPTGLNVTPGSSSSTLRDSM